MAYPAGVNFQPTTQAIGAQQLSETSLVKRHALGTIITASDITYGAGEFIYLKGVALTAKGDVVCFDQNLGTTVRAVSGGASSTGPVAIAMSDNVASQYGWYQVAGAGPANSATASANTQAHLSATAGRVDDATDTPIAGMIIKSATVAGFCTVQMNRPSISAAASAADGGILTVAAVGSTPAAAGASVAGTVLTLQPADATNPGVVTAGAQTFGGTKTFPNVISNGSVTSGSHRSTGQIFIWGEQADGASAVGATIGPGPTYANAGAHLVNIATGITGVLTTKAFFDKDGNLEINGGAAGFVIIQSPDGTRYKIVVANGGTLSATAA